MTPDWKDTLRDHCRRHGQRRTADLIGYSQGSISLVLRGAYMANTDKIETAVREHLGGEAWLTALRGECKRTSQAQCALRLGISETTLSQVLSGSYKASTLRIERRVRGELLREECSCPVMGSVSMYVCQDVQDRQRGQIGNPIYMQAWYACRGQGAYARHGQRCQNFNGAGAGAKADKTEGQA